MLISYQPSHDPYKTALAHHQKKEYTEAKSLYLKAIERQPQKAEAWVNLASVCDALGEGEDALTYVEKALKLNPRVRDGYFNKGAILRRLQRWEEAIKAFQISLAHSPQDHDAYYYMGQCYFSLSRFDLALEAYKKASNIRPTLASIYAAGKCYQHLSLLEAAILCFKECVKIKSDDRAAQFDLAFCYTKIENYPELQTLVSELQSVNNLTLDQQHTLFFAKQELSWWSEGADEALNLVLAIERQRLDNPQLSLNPWTAITLPLSLRSRYIFSQRFSASTEKKYCNWKNSHVVPLIRPKRLRIGYLSMDFRVHPMAFLIQSVFKLHDRARVELFAYSYGRNDNSEARRVIEQSVDHFVDIEKDDVITAAKKITADGIDILIDLAGFTTGSRFAILALRPAPLQVNYLGYCLSTGSQSIDYFLGDKTIIQEEEEIHYSEKIAYLPHTFITINHEEKICSQLAGTRADWGLAHGAFVYGCFNAIYKIEPAVFTAWMEILKAVPNSVLWLLSKHDIIAANLRQEAVKRGVEPNRLIFSAYKPREEHLARHQHMDLFLDTWQVNAVTTTCDAVYAGVPVLTLAGDYPLSRAGKSIMQAAGSPILTQQFIAKDREDYRQKAIHFGLHRQEFALLKKEFQEKLPQSPLLDMPAKVKAMEAAYEKMWALHQQGLPPQSFSVEDIY